MERSGHIVEILDLGDARIFEPYRVKKREDLGSHRREEHIGTLHRGHRRRSSLRPTFGIRGGRKQDGAAATLATIAPYACSSVTGTPARTVLCISATASVTRKSSAILSGAAEDDTLAR